MWLIKFAFSTMWWLIKNFDLWFTIMGVLILVMFGTSGEAATPGFFFAIVGGVIFVLRRIVLPIIRNRNKEE